MTAWATYPYRGRSVLVTGGGTGIGRAIARAFLQQGADVTVVGRSPAPLFATVADFPRERTMVMTTDLTDPAGLAAAVDEIQTRFGGLDVVVANTGTGGPGSRETFDDEARLRPVDVDAMVRLARLTVPLLRESRGNFLAVSSIAGPRGDWGRFAYNTTRAAVGGLVRSLALDLGGDGIRVNAIAPAFTRSRPAEDLLGDPDRGDLRLDGVALGRMSEPEDIARAALYLAGPDAGCITGVVLPVDGGTGAAAGTTRPG
ncbi:MAG: SDR family oxidoreductase [Gordonia sp. (in: high G+C Gram-positive bacteria)]|uniref:SDR family NAD(P)-dependent oxidoreductase n=1 Tax=Gordonia sp. (in: high G+C Gram-positive bacteria) TaxID=84139 RepID=UPI0039E6E46E